MKFNCLVKPEDHLEVEPDEDGDILIAARQGYGVAHVTLTRAAARDLAALLIHLADAKPETPETVAKVTP